MAVIGMFSHLPDSARGIAGRLQELADEDLALRHRERRVGRDDVRAEPRVGREATWEKQVLSARGFKRVGRHSEYAI